MKKHLLIYKESMRVSIASAATYRANFILHSIITLLGNIVFPLVTLLIYGSGASFEGWSMYEVLLIQSIFTMSTGLSNMFFGGMVWNTMEHVREGTFETVLIKPVDCMFYLLATNFGIHSFGVVAGGMVVFIISLVHVGNATILMWLQFLLLFLMGLFVMLGMELLMAATSFKWVANSRIPEMYGSVRQFGNYPQTIFNKSIIYLTSFILPVGMIGFFPASALLGRLEWWMLVSIFPCILFLMLGVWVYRYMVPLYEGVGG